MSGFVSYTLLSLFIWCLQQNRLGARAHIFLQCIWNPEMSCWNGNKGTDVHSQWGERPEVKWPAYPKDHNLWDQIQSTPQCMGTCNFQSTLQIKHMYSIYVAERTIYFLGKGLLGTRVLQQFDSNAWQDVSKGHPGFTKLVCNIWCLPGNALERDNEYLDCGKMLIVRPEQ